jgi:hypothetical protein
MIQKLADLRNIFLENLEITNTTEKLEELEKDFLGKT